MLHGLPFSVSVNKLARPSSGKERIMHCLSFFGNFQISHYNVLLGNAVECLNCDLAEARLTSEVGPFQL